MSVESRFAAHVAALQSRSIPAAAKQALASLWLDTTAVMLAGRFNPECRRIAAAFGFGSVDGACSIVGESGRVSPASAAFANGVCAHWYDWDDTHDDSHVHASAVIFPALIAAFESRAGLDGRAPAVDDFVAAAIAAMDVACRIGGLLKDHSHRGWMPTGSGGAIGAAAGAARVLGLGAHGVLSAMGIAAAGVGFSRQALADRVNGKNILAGVAAKNAVEAALLAKRGVSGAPNFLTGMYGLEALHGVPAGRSADIANDLTQRYAVCDVSTKPYPSCRSTHAALDLVFELLQEHGHAQVRAVHLRVPEGVHERVGRRFEAGENPRIAAQFSLPFTVSLALRKGRVTPADFEPAAVLAFVQECGDLIGRVDVQAVATPAKAGDVQTPVTATFLMDDGGSLVRTATRIRGSPECPATSGEARDKLALAVGANLTSRQQDSLANASLSLCELGPSAALDLLRTLDSKHA